MDAKISYSSGLNLEHDTGPSDSFLKLEVQHVDPETSDSFLSGTRADCLSSMGPLPGGLFLQAFVRTAADNNAYVASVFT